MQHFYYFLFQAILDFLLHTDLNFFQQPSCYMPNNMCSDSDLGYVGVHVNG